MCRNVCRITNLVRYVDPSPNWLGATVTQHKTTHERMQFIHCIKKPLPCTTSPMAWSLMQTRQKISCNNIPKRSFCAPTKQTVVQYKKLDTYVSAVNSDLIAIDHSPFVHNRDEGAKKAVANAVSKACQELGCFYVCGEGVMDFDIMIQAREDARKFFLQNLTEKHLVMFPGFPIGRGFSKLPERSRSIAPNDLLESWVMGPPDAPETDYYMNPEAMWHFLPNLWPKYPSTFKRSWTNYYNALTNVANILLRCFALAMDLPEDYMAKVCDKGPHSLKVNYYSKVVQPLKDQPRVLEHTDATLFTILAHMDPTPKALAVQKKATKEWVFADPVPGGMFINIGDFMERWTNNRFVSTVHRVEWPWEEKYINQVRLSSAFFAVPNYEEKLGILPTCKDENTEDEQITYTEYLANHRQRIKPSGY